MLAGVHTSSLRHHQRHGHGDDNSRRHHETAALARGHGSLSAPNAAPSKTTQKAIFAAGVDLDSLLALKPNYAIGHRPDGNLLSSVECHATLRILLGIVLDLLVAHQVGAAMRFLEFIMGKDALTLPLDSQVDWGAEGLFPSAVDFGRHEQESFSDLLLGMYTTLTEDYSGKAKFKQTGRSRTQEFDHEGGAAGPLWGGSNGSWSHNVGKERAVEKKQSGAAKEEEEEDEKPPPGMMALLQKRRHNGNAGVGQRSPE